MAESQQERPDGAAEETEAVEDEEEEEEEDEDDDDDDEEESQTAGASRGRLYAAAEKAAGAAFEAGEETYETAATLTAALLSRLALPDDRDAAADYAVALFWRVRRGLLSESPAQARPDHPHLHVPRTPPT